jgi:hypothetical protein
MKTCSRCKREKSFAELARGHGTRDGYFTYCRACMNDYCRERRAGGKEALAEAVAARRLERIRRAAAKGCARCRELEGLLARLRAVLAEPEFAARPAGQAG